MKLEFLIRRKALLILLLIIFVGVFLRFYKLGSNPPGLYWDEAVFGYDAYSILKTAHDHHGRFLPLFFESFGDWKMPVYHYLLVSSIAIFGLNEFAVRFPSALLGTLTVVVFYFLVKNLLSSNESRSMAHESRKNKNINNSKFIIHNSEKISLLATFFLAISAWHIQFSRAGFESTAGLFFVVTGVYLFSLWKDSPKSIFYTFAMISFTLSMYSYHAYRILTPLLVVILVYLNFKIFKKVVRSVILPSTFSLILLIPLIIFTFSQEGRARAISQSAFKKEEIEKARIDYDQKSKKPLRFLSKYLYQSPIYFSYVAVDNYVDQFSPIFLFFKGDQIGRHSQVDMGQIHYFEAVLILLSILTFKRLTPDAKKIMATFLLLSPITAIIVEPTPHAQRTLQMALPLAFFSGLGAYFMFSQKQLTFLKVLMLVASTYFFLSYLHLLFVHYPQKFAADWQDGYKQMVREVKKYQDSYEKVYITNINQVPYIYVLFYGKYDPQKFKDLQGTKDSFDKYVFISDDVNIYDKALLAGPLRSEASRQGGILYVAPSWQKVDGKWLAAVDDNTGRHIYSLWEIGGQD